MLLRRLPTSAAGAAAAATRGAPSGRASMALRPRAGAASSLLRPAVLGPAGIGGRRGSSSGGSGSGPAAGAAAAAGPDAMEAAAMAAAARAAAQSQPQGLLRRHAGLCAELSKARLRYDEGYVRYVHAHTHRAPT